MEDEEIIIKKGNVEEILSEKRLRVLTEQFLEACAKEANLIDDFGMNCKMLDSLIKVKQAFFPATQKNFNVNVEAFDDKVSKWMQARKEMQEAQMEKVEVFEVQ